MIEKLPLLYSTIAIGSIQDLQFVKTPINDLVYPMLVFRVSLNQRFRQHGTAQHHGDARMVGRVFLFL